ncbi:hypothetical protein ABIB85_001919 [Bradyrhizobium sp. JR1.5]
MTGSGLISSARSFACVAATRGAITFVRGEPDV